MCTKQNTRRKFDSRVAGLAKRLGTDLSYDYAACYGGYCLTDASGSRRYSMRMDAKQFAGFLAGMDLVADMKARGNW